MELLHGSINEYAERLASPSSVPGGGSASALAGAVGAALGSMVGELTVDKPAYADVDAEMRRLMARAKELSRRLLACVEKDTEAFEPLCRAYRIPLDDPGRDEVMERCLKDAAAVPLEVMDLCCEAIELQRAFAEKGNRLVISDAATGAALCTGALYGAAVNVKVNTDLMKDRPYAEAVNAHVDAVLARCRGLAEEAFDIVYRRFC